jgi:hypothetical protein
VDGVAGTGGRGGVVGAVDGVAGTGFIFARWYGLVSSGKLVQEWTTSTSPLVTASPKKAGKSHSSAP